MVDFSQEPVIDFILADFKGPKYDKLWTGAINDLRAALAMEWQWQVLDDYTCDSDPSKTVTKFPPGKAPMQIMLECYKWETSAGNSSKQFISCFTIDGSGESEMITGPVNTQREGNAKLYVRVLLDDKWRFSAGRRFRSRVKLEEDLLQVHGMTSFSSPLEALQTVSTDANIKAFNFNGWGTKDEKDLVKDNDATLTSGVWVRN
ncbi:hypothetical protein BYT27DRAFT_6734201 [Phlegmacium glaucopus]|nr:hypothetical protein BYT27DRAFT_6734201 [Phlegmacium glaucopus]